MSLTTTPEFARRVRTPAYTVFGVALLFAILDFVLSIYPLHPRTVMWRFGAVGLSATAIAGPLLLLLLIYVVSLVAEDRAVTWFVGLFSAFISLILLLGVGAFALDALQMKAQVQPQALSKFTIASAQAIVKLIIYAITAAVLAVSALKTAKASTRKVSKRSERASSNLIVGNAATAKPVVGERVEPTSMGR